MNAGKKRLCREVMNKPVLFARAGDSILKISDAMVRNAVSQMPVLSGNTIVGTVTEENIIRNLSSNLAEKKVKQVMTPPLPSVSEDTNIEAVRPMLEKSQGVLVMKGREIVGIITRSDLLKTIA